MAKELWALDTEDNSKGKVHLINFYDGKNHHTFRTPQEAVDFLASQEKAIDIWATNLAYDLSNLFQGNMNCLRITYIKGRVISAQISNTKIYFKDTLNHWKISVADMGKRIKLYKYKTNDFNNVKYCRRDTLITHRFVKLMSEKYEEIGAKLKSTIGSTALDLFQTRFHSRPVKRIFESSDIDWMLNGYYGGRVEIFHTERVFGNICYYDFNSLYPSCMFGHRFPVPDRHKFRMGFNENAEGISEVTVWVPDSLRIPYLPHRSPQGLIFPTGKLRGRWTNFELREAQKYGVKILKAHKSIEFLGTVQPFDEFVDTLYKFRLKAQKEKDELLSDSAKLILNNLYGKYAQGNEITRLLPYNETKLKTGDRLFKDLVLRDEVNEYPLHTNVVWSAYVTAYARDRLFRGMRSVEENGGLLLYCDTDSIVYKGDPIFPNSKNLGELKLEGVWETAHFKLPKLYHLGGEKEVFKAKGVPRIKAKDFFEKGVAEFQRPNKLRESLRRNLVPNEWHTTKKEVRRKYDKRIIGKNGKTSPISIGKASRTINRRTKTKNQLHDGVH